MHINIEQDEINALFTALDTNKNATVDLTELIEFFAEVNTS